MHKRGTFLNHNVHKSLMFLQFHPKWTTIEFSQRYKKILQNPCSPQLSPTKITVSPTYPPDLDDSYSSSEDYHSSDGAKLGVPPPSINPFTTNGDGNFTDFEAFVAKFNVLVQALVDSAKSMERRIGDEKSELLAGLFL